MNINDFYNEIARLNDPNSLKLLIQNVLKNYCINQTITTQYIKSFTDLVVESIANISGNTNDIDILRKLITSIGLIARYSPYINSFKSYLDRVINDILLVTLRSFNNVTDYDSVEIRALYVETIRSYTLILQAYNDQMDKYTKPVIESLTKHFDSGLFPVIVQSEIEQYSITSILELVAVLIQTSPTLILDNFNLLQYIINVFINLDIEKFTPIFDEIVNVIGHYLQMFIYVPFESLEQTPSTQKKKHPNARDEESDDDDDEDQDDETQTLTAEQRQEQLKIKRSELSNYKKPSIQQSIQLLQKVTSSPNHPKKESCIILMGIISSYSLIHHYCECQPVVEIVFNHFSDRFNEQDEHLKLVINCLAYVFSNTPRELEIVQQYLPVFFNKVTLYFTNIKNHSKENPTNKSLRTALAASREIVSHAISKMLLLFDCFFEYADEFISFAYVLAEPMVLSNFLYALLFQLESSTSNEQRQQFDQVYLPKVMKPLLSQLSSKYQSSTKLSSSILKSLNNISTFGEMYIKDYYNDIIDLVETVLKCSWQTFIPYSIDSISILSKITIKGECSQVQLEKIWRIFGLILTDRIVSNEDGIDFDLVNRSKFIVLEEISSYLESVVNGTCASSKTCAPKPEQLATLYRYLLANIGCVEVTFDSDLYLRMSQLTVLNSLLKYSEKVVVAAAVQSNDVSKDIDSSIHSVVAELILLSNMDDEEQQDTLMDHFIDIVNSSNFTSYKVILERLF
ncbi:hypothetical protein PPL_03252 [Heterostelium album PN500]|uniref:Uncharacterized protein n=1 Tax=Heterostelium pallidum (strain ATCC 26659 / Pp 5 / PN500) TaxID=670386 RepID=D3B4D0_HETP5|nr:hypothetical protein PPL_03252 [Heterostelium album PN500]EFA84178.1 hypothetical protein PPL_03252 [Heterostelium album PN500]|eukprot:XP_020436295.1 hypothetical protein PPL_03252 [Heterostelium album PN500]